MTQTLLAVSGAAVSRIVLAGAIAIFGTGVAGAADIRQLKTDKSFEGRFVDEDVCIVLGRLLQAVDLNVTCKPDVHAIKVDATFANEPIGGVFNRIITEKGLTYTFDGTKTVTISMDRQATTDYLPLKFLTDDSALRDFDDVFPNVSRSFKPTSRIIVLKGDQDQVAKFKTLIASLDTSAGEAVKVQADTQESATRAAQNEAAAQKGRAEAQLLAERVEAERQQRLDIEQVTIKVIPLRFANVGPVRVKFQGEDVTVPGLIETLNNLLGVTASKASGQQDQTNTPRLINAPLVKQNESSDEAGARPVLSLVQSSQVVRVDASAFRGAISADARTNSVVVRGTPREIKQVEQLVAKLDRPMEQVEIETMIVATTKSMMEDIGVRFGQEGIASDSRGGAIGGAIATMGTSALSVAPGLGTTQFGTGTNALGGRIQGQPVNQSYGSIVSPLSLLPLGNGTVASFVYRGARNALSAYVNAQAQEQKAHLLSAPRVVTLDNIGAKITADGTIFVPTSAGANSSGAFLQIPAGLTLKITPSVLRRDDVGEDNMLRLVIEAENTTANFQNGSAARSGQQIQTQIIIPDGSTFILGGLTTDQRTEGVERVPLLSDIPILGELFKLRGSDQSLAETVFFITPRIVPRADLYTKDVAEKRYLQTQRADLERVGNEIMNGSPLLNLNARTLREDE